MDNTTFTGVLQGALPGKDGLWDVTVDGGVVRTVEAAGGAVPDLGGPETVLAPALLDIQVNGARGIDLLDPALTVDHIRAITEYLAGHGVAWWIPTIITAAPEAMARAARVLAQARREPDLARAIPGLHLEGPHISPEDGPRGAHPREMVCPPDTDLLDRLVAAAEDAVAYVTLAPEWPGAADYIRKLRAAEIVASLGHHQADESAISAAVDAGATLCTHLGNGAAPLMHRHRNPLWPQLAEDRLIASIIADGHHLPPAVLKTFIRTKGAGRIVLVSDCVSLAGMPPGRYDLFGAAVELSAAGKVSLSGTDLLAGSACRLVECIEHLVSLGLMMPAEAFASASEIPARLLGIDGVAEGLVPGTQANCVLMDGWGREMRYGGKAIVHGVLREPVAP